MNDLEAIAHCKGIFKQIEELLTTLESKEALKRSFIAGGCFVNLFHKEKVKDYDIWFRSEEDWTKLVAGLSSGTMTKFAKNIKLSKGEKIQFIKTRCGQPYDTIKTFDFEHTRCFCTYDGQLEGYAVQTITYVSGQTSLDQRNDCMYNKYLSYCKGSLCHPVNTADRIIKKIKEGFDYDESTLVDFLCDIRAVKSDDDIIKSSRMNGSA